MPNVSLGNGRLAWWLILESARRARANLISVEERKIILITPWIRDVPVDHAMWSPTSISAALGKDSSEIELLSDVLVAMSTTLQFKIQICIRDEIGRTVPRRQSTRVDQEYSMLRKLQDKGIQALKIHRSHKKMLITPLGATTGSMNFTYAGTRINRENNHFYFKSQDLEDYEATTNNARREIEGAIPYFDDERIEWSEFTQRYEEDIEASAEAPEIESLGASPEEPPSPNIKPEDYPTPDQTASANQTMSPKALWLAIESAQENHEYIPEYLKGQFFVNYIRWEKKLREVVNNVYSKYIRRARDIKEYAKFKKIIDNLETKWHYLVSVKIERVKPLPDPLTMDFTERGKKLSVFKAGKSKVLDHLDKCHSTRMKEEDLTSLQVLSGTDPGQLLWAAGFYHEPGKQPGRDGAQHEVREAWYDFLKDALSISHGEAQRKFTELCLHAMRVYFVRNPELHANDVPIKYLKEGAESIYKFYELLYNPHDKWVQE
jgi:hypothetical protein